MSAPIAFDDVAQALAASGSTVHAAEAHGCLCGALCARRVYLPAEWLEELLPDGPEPGKPAGLVAGGPLRQLFDQSRAVLEAREMEFEPLLPPDAAALAERVAGARRLGAGLPLRLRRQRACTSAAFSPAR